MGSVSKRDFSGFSAWLLAQYDEWSGGDPEKNVEAFASWLRIERGVLEKTLIGTYCPAAPEVERISLIMFTSYLWVDPATTNPVQYVATGQ